MEDWEKQCKNKQDPLNEARFDRKYKGIRFYNIDANEEDILNTFFKTTYMKNVGYVLNCKRTVDSEERHDLTDKPWYMHNLINCVIDERNTGLNKHV